MKLFKTIMQNAEMRSIRRSQCRMQNCAKRRVALFLFRIPNSAFIIGLLTLVIVFTSCSDDDFDKRTVIPEASWKQENFVAFDVDINDTISPYEFGIGLRHLENYRYSNLFVFLHTTMPNGNHTHDTIECTLATPEGKWIGKSSGSMRDLTVTLNENLLFPLSGTYHFEIEQAMREPVLKGISDIGLFIEKH